MRVLRAASAAFGFDVELADFDFASADHYQQHGTMLPDDWFDILRGFDAIFFGGGGLAGGRPGPRVAVGGEPAAVPPPVRPVREPAPGQAARRGVRSPLADRRPGDVDFLVVRENTEGEYSSVGGKMFEGTDRETVLQETVMTRVGVDRILKYAFELAQARPARHLTSATKSNGISITMPYWDERVVEAAAGYPDVRVDKYHIDILTAQFVMNPRPFRRRRRQQPVRRHPLRPRPGLHRHDRHRAQRQHQPPSAPTRACSSPCTGRPPDIAGKGGIANPVGQIWCVS